MKRFEKIDFETEEKERDYETEDCYKYHQAVDNEMKRVEASKQNKTKGLKVKNEGS